ncbi:type VI secretion system protein TssA [Luteimonas sp. RD2P54]|uniref:Type VI secretion system protein TssA n=1 Tax=Luteimonas endophytica TaxID=3042023 RepID=A0ABT6JA95_9GAMM|nr:type VI secretion system protein TssA [Luteimonas endophytica]MDH5823746.1 type VI secretion system protein TssA [Luteimonas endophytica]
MLELEDLLAPISEDSPTGEDLSFSPEFDAIQEARRADDPTLEQGEWVTDIKYADWTAASRMCADLLRTRTKDLRLGAWLAESSAQVHGFPGLAVGFRLVAGLCDRYWDEVHPQAADGDHEERIGNLTWLLSNALQWLRTLPIAQGPQGRFGLGDFEAAHARSGAGDAGGDGQPDLEVMEAARRDTPHEFYLQLMQDVPDCVMALQELQLSVDARLGTDGPSFTPVRDQLEHLQKTVQRFARDAGVLVGDAGAAAQGFEVEAGGGTEAGGPAATGQGGPIASRRQALAQLRQVAEFFRRTEPHSPVAYLADKAARWGEMPLHVWLKRVIKDDNALSQVEELLDIDGNQESFGG